MAEKRTEKTVGRFSCGTIKGGTWESGHPLSVGGCLIMLCERGKAVFSINSRDFVMEPGCMGIVASDMVVVPADISVDFEVRCLSINFDEAQDIFFLVTSNRFWDFIYKSPVFVLPERLRPLLNSWFGLLDWISDNCSEAIRDRMMRNEAENFILNVAEQVELRLGVLRINPSKNRTWAIINDFVGLLGRHYAAHHDVAFYAGRLNVTPNYLNIITKRHVGITAKEQISIQIGLVTKMLLDKTDLSVKQIAERLHYDDPSYLCRIFRKQTGMSPMQYRNNIRMNADGGKG